MYKGNTFSKKQLTHRMKKFKTVNCSLKKNLALNWIDDLDKVNNTNAN